MAFDLGLYIPSEGYRTISDLGEKALAFYSGGLGHYWRLPLVKGGEEEVLVALPEFSMRGLSTVGSSPFSLNICRIFRILCYRRATLKR